MVQRQMPIGGKLITVIDCEKPQSELLFYAENPRIHSYIMDLGDNPSQNEIQKIMIKQEHVKMLKQSIELNGGLLEPVIVKGNVVLEGNSRLAAYRILAGKDPVKWGNIRCSVLPDDTSDDSIFALLGTLHLVGKTEWSPFEQAGYLVRRTLTSRKPVEALANEVGMKAADAKAYIAVYNAMQAAQENRPSQWSRFYELHKSRELQKANENRPQIRLVERITEMIKDDKIHDSQDIRKFAIIAKAKSENAQEALEGVLNEDISIDEGVDLVSQETKVAALVAKTEAFRDYLNKEFNSYIEYKNDVALRQAINAVLYQLKGII